jgi:hypothetical protein
LGSVRILVEQFNGRLKMRFPILKSKYIGARSGLKEFIFVCVYLTNVDLEHHPLHAEDLTERDLWWGEAAAKLDDDFDEGDAYVDV